jgi:protein tyrosine phosphatase
MQEINTEDDDNSFRDYINASYINSILKKGNIIAASAPTEPIVCDFLQMIIENKISLIMKVCDYKVMGREQCFKYCGELKPTEGVSGFKSIEKLYSKITEMPLPHPTNFLSSNSKTKFTI